jgi:hypothetical protein
MSHANLLRAASALLSASAIDASAHTGALVVAMREARCQRPGTSARLAASDRIASASRRLLVSWERNGVSDALRAAGYSETLASLQRAAREAPAFGWEGERVIEARDFFTGMVRLAEAAGAAQRMRDALR